MEGNDRYEKKIPPGYKDAIKKSGILDNNAYGDLIVWKEILRFSKKEKKNIIYVTVSFLHHQIYYQPFHQIVQEFYPK